MPISIGKLLPLGLLSAALMLESGCSSDYGLFNVTGYFADPAATTYQSVEHCRLTVKDAAGGIAVNSYTIPKSNGDSPQLGQLSYSTSATSGTLTFIIQGLDNSNKIIEGGKSSAAVKVFHSQNDIVDVNVSMTTCTPPAGTPANDSCGS